MTNIIPIHVTRAAKARGVGVGAYLAAKALGLSPIQCEAVMRKARADYARGVSPAMSIARASAEARRMATQEPA